jgi:hypothetical protein
MPDAPAEPAAAEETQTSGETDPQEVTPGMLGNVPSPEYAQPDASERLRRESIR